MGAKIREIMGLRADFHTVVYTLDQTMGSPVTLREKTLEL
jgi:hypothetical protein